MLKIIKVSGNVSYLLNWVIVEQAHRQQAVKGCLPATVQAISKFEVPQGRQSPGHTNTAERDPPLLLPLVVVTGLPGGGGGTR